MVHFACPGCKSVLHTQDDKIGKTGTCPRCSQKVTVPSPLESQQVQDWRIAPPPVARQLSPDLDEESAEPCSLDLQQEERSFSAWRRYLPSAPLGLAFLFFFLPWINVSCNTSQGPHLMGHQSGFQAMCGNYSSSGLSNEVATKIQQQRKEVYKKAIRETEIDPAPLVAIYFLFVITGAIIGLFPKPARSLMVAILSAALVFLVIQMIAGFPVEQSIIDRLAESKGQGKYEIEASIAVSSMIEISYTPWLWMSLMAIILSLGLAGFETFLAKLAIKGLPKD